MATNGTDPNTCGQPLQATGAALLVPTTTGPISNATPRLISTMFSEPIEVKETPTDALPLSDKTVSPLSMGATCPWWCILIALVIGYMVVRER